EEDLDIPPAATDEGIRTITVEIEKRDGLWDVSPSDDIGLDDPLPQSRIGPYVIVHRIIETQ
ncbi:MAG: hypothetical protein MI892_21260, partial [Desulfobacterales bacterium]|nr:hypothetical protein [Desulfobacterales bacterium]